MDYLKQKFSWREIDSSHRLMLLIVIMLNVFNFLWGEKCPASNGLGWDGVTFADMVRNVDTSIRMNQLSNYYAHRSLPSITIRAIMQLFQISMNDINIIKTYEVFNFVLLMMVFFAWKKITDHFELNLGARWVGFCGIFLSFWISKVILYLPVTTDVTGLLVAVLLLYFFLKKRPISILVTTLFGAFCWPGVAIAGALLLLFLRFELPSKIISPEPSVALIKESQLKRLYKYSGILILSAVVLRPVVSFIKPETRASSFLTGLPALCFIILAMMLLLGSFSFFAEIWAKRGKFSYELTIMAIMAVVIPYVVGKLISNPDLPNWNTFSLLKDLIFFPPDNKFLLPFISMSLFLGPTFLLILIFWKEICVEIRKLGPGAMAVVAIHLPLGLVSEPRFYTLIWPLLLLCLLIVSQKIVFSQNLKKLFIVLTILFSKFWLIINWGFWSPGITDNLSDFPKQFLFMHYGLYTSWLTYLIHLPLIILCGFLLKKSVVEIKN